MDKEEAEPVVEEEGQVEKEQEQPGGKVPREIAASTAMEVLDTLLKLMGVGGEVEVISGDLPLSLNIESEEVGLLIGHRGQTLSSLEYITKLVVAARLGEWVPLYVDVAGYKKRRQEALQRLALYLADQVVTRQREMSLEPMPANERRIIHITLSDHPEVETHSVGDGWERKVVISPR
ncbi:MAG: KH domain-containing protein [Dehalococcoidia bacterium]|nr:KH domain-containing protein [Dehalococcoidia bacterium]